MGDITGRPKAPEPQIVYVPQYVSTPAPGSSTTTTSSSPAPSPDEPASETPEARREKTLLTRARGRLGTILTGFRGLLAPLDPATSRKTLLGE